MKTFAVFTSRDWCVGGIESNFDDSMDVSWLVDAGDLGDRWYESRGYFTCGFWWWTVGTGLESRLSQSINQISTSLNDLIYLAFKFLMGEILCLPESASWLSRNCLLYFFCLKIWLLTFLCRPIAGVSRGWTSLKFNRSFADQVGLLTCENII